MLFNSIQYLLFLPLVVALYWLSPQKFRVPILLLASYGFYMSWRPIFVFLILGLTILNYLLGKAIWKDQANKKKWLASAIVLNLSTLAYFKYAYFLDDLLCQMLAPLGVHMGKLPINIVLPLGISFFVFEFIHYVVDVYRGHEPIRSFPTFALFASFFPTQIAGPIKRFQDFIPQFLTPARFRLKYFEDGLVLILLGLFKKVLIADNLAFFVQGGFMHPQLFTGVDLWLFTYSFAFQIYFDFSGYTDIARGSAKLFGFKVPLNFNLPYVADNIANFWHRWHISLSTWLRDYLFIPLGGSRCGRFINGRNLLLTMTLGGLWHGASMHFVAWGVYHGLMLLVHKEFSRFRASVDVLSTAMASPIGKAFSVVLTFHAVCLGWVLFRADNMQLATSILSKMFFLQTMPNQQSALSMVLPTINYPLMYPAMFLLLPLLAVSHFGSQLVAQRGWIRRVPVPLKAAWCVAIIFLVATLSPDKSPRFIYFQF